jgi:RING finger/CHY zinc finger protein 1
MDYKYSGCTHYKRKAQLLAPCCNQFFPCRFCHDEAQTDPKKAHTLDRHSVVTIKCMLCNTEQEKAQICISCKEMLGAYWCSICVLLDDEDKGQFHCGSCGICRIGGSANYSHCDRCGICMKTAVLGAHTCVANASRVNCSICLEDLHTSRVPISFLPCGHSLHQPCMQSFLTSGANACPLCKRCAMSLEQQQIMNLMLDSEIDAAPMPEEYRDKRVRIRCYECRAESDAPFHIFGLKCQGPECGSYNTVKI